MHNQKSNKNNNAIICKDASLGRVGYKSLLFQFKDIERWYNNFRRSSKIATDVYLRRLGHVCRLKEITPVERAKADELWAYNLLIDLVTDFENRGKAGSYIHSNVKAIKSWLYHNKVRITGF